MYMVCYASCNTETPMLIARQEERGVNEERERERERERESYICNCKSIKRYLAGWYHPIATGTGEKYIAGRAAKSFDSHE